MLVYLGFRSKVSTKLRTLEIRRDTCFLRNAKLYYIVIFLGKRKEQKLASNEVVSHFVALSFSHWGFWSLISYLTRVPFSKKGIVRVFRCRTEEKSQLLYNTLHYLPCIIE